MSIRHQPGEILLATLIFSSQAGQKRRPVLVIQDPGDDDLLVAPVTSHGLRSAHDLTLNDWPQAGLRLPSVVRLEKLATIEKGTVVRVLGRLSVADHDRVAAALPEFFKQVTAGW